MGYGLPSRQTVNAVGGRLQARNVQVGCRLWALDGERTVHSTVTEVVTAKVREVVDVVTDHDVHRGTGSVVGYARRLGSRQRCRGDRPCVDACSEAEPSAADHQAWLRVRLPDRGQLRGWDSRQELCVVGRQRRGVRLMLRGLSHGGSRVAGSLGGRDTPFWLPAAGCTWLPSACGLFVPG